MWPNGAFLEGRGINTLTGADSPKPNGGAAFHDTAVWVRGEMAPAGAEAHVAVPV